ncbi:MAG: hypothetical protein ACO39Q_00810 [Ilumatobacteraceae bacterium]
MSARCDRPGCSEPAAVEYRILHDRLIVWLASIGAESSDAVSGLCVTHADSLRLPRGWSIDDEREPVPKLFAAGPQVGTPKRRSPARPSKARSGEQLEFITSDEPAAECSEETRFDGEPEPGESLPPLLERAFRGTPMRQ